jgi:hypothetical protein
MIDPKGLWIFGALVDGKLDLAHTKLDRSVILDFCAIPEGVRLSQAETRYFDLDGTWTSKLEAHETVIHSSLHLKNGFRAFRGADLEGATIDGDLDARGGSFHFDAAADEHSPSEIALEGKLHIGGKVRLGGFKDAPVFPTPRRLPIRRGHSP